jgi:hypothetical protein
MNADLLGKAVDVVYTGLTAESDLLLPTLVILSTRFTR